MTLSNHFKTSWLKANNSQRWGPWLNSCKKWNRRIPAVTMKLTISFLSSSIRMKEEWLTDTKKTVPTKTLTRLDRLRSSKWCTSPPGSKHLQSIQNKSSNSQNKDSSNRPDPSPHLAPLENQNLLLIQQRSSYSLRRWMILSKSTCLYPGKRKVNTKWIRVSRTAQGIERRLRARISRAERTHSIPWTY